MGSFIAPQIAVALGLLHGAAARPFLESTLDEPSPQQRPKEVVSAHRVLVRLGIHPIREISVDAWPVIERDNAILADKVVAEHWDFWQPRL